MKAFSENKPTETPARRKAGRCEEGGGSAKPRRRGCVLPPRSFLLLAQNLQAVALQESGVLGVAEDGLRLGMLGAVQFDHEAGAGTVKIYTGKRH